MAPNILITDASSYKSTVISRFIKNNYPESKLYMVSRLRINPTFITKYKDKFFPLDFSSDEKYISKLEKLVHRLKIDYIIPVNSAEIELLLINRKKFLTSLDYIGEIDTFRLLNDKSLFIERCNNLNVPVPSTYTLDSIKSSKIRNFVVKPTLGSGSAGVKYFSSKNLLKNYCSSLKSNYIIQEYFKGKGGGVSVFCNNGKILNAYGHTRILEFPSTGGSSAMRGRLKSSIYNKTLLHVEKITKNTNWSGFCMFEIKYNKDKIAFIEANPRIWGSIGQGLNDGVNYFSSIIGEKRILSKSKYTFNTFLILASLFSSLMEGNLSRDKDIFKALRSGRADIELIDDSKGFFGTIFRNLL